LSQDNEEIARLVVAAQAGDRLAMGQLSARYFRAAYARALAIVIDPSDAQDLAQDAFVAALTRIETCRDPNRFSAWLMKIVRNHAINWLSKRRIRSADAFDDVQVKCGVQFQADLVYERGREWANLLQALSQLTEIQREVVLLHDLHDWTHGEIAQALGLSEGMSRQHLFKARKLLRQRLEHPESEKRSDGRA
jgi:RNA polymerase sigma-70 factor (ECF subfamily)